MSANTDNQTAWSRKKAHVLSASAAVAGVIAAVGVWSWWDSRDVPDAATVDLALVSRSTLHAYSFPHTDPGEGRAAIPASLVVFDPRLQPYRLTKAELLALSPHHAKNADDIAPNPASLAEALGQVEAREVHDSVDPLGYTVAVDFTVDGLAGEPLLLTWSLHGTQVSAHWHATRLGVRLEPAIDEHSGSADIWVPDLRSPGDYTVEVQIVRATGGASLASGTLHVPAAETPDE